MLADKYVLFKIKIEVDPGGPKTFMHDLAMLKVSKAMEPYFAKYAVHTMLYENTGRLESMSAFLSLTLARMVLDYTNQEPRDPEFLEAIDNLAWFVKQCYLYPHAQMYRFL